MVGHGGSSAVSYLADPASPIPSHSDVIILFKIDSVIFERISVKSVQRVLQRKGTLLY